MKMIIFGLDMHLKNGIFGLEMLDFAYFRLDFWKYDVSLQHDPLNTFALSEKNALLAERNVEFSQ